MKGRFLGELQAVAFWPLRYEPDRLFIVVDMSDHTQSRPGLKLACEIAGDRVLAGRASERGGSVECASYELRPSTVVPDLTEANIRDRTTVFHTIRDALDSIAGKAKDVIAVLPDPAVRIVLLDFEALPANRHEAEAVVRFRLKKSLPFDVEKAKVSYHAHPVSSGVRVIAAVALNSIIDEYESVFREAGYNPGIVLPSTLAALGAANAERPTLVVKVDERTTSIAILDRNQVLLFRTLENPYGAAITGERLAEDVYPSVVFFQDTYQLDIAQIFVAGLRSTTDAAPALKAQTGADVRELLGSVSLEDSSGTVPKWRMAGIVGALAS
jgi:type IV pilus assembly protein PilM